MKFDNMLCELVTFYHRTIFKKQDFIQIKIPELFGKLRIASFS